MAVTHLPPINYEVTYSRGRPVTTDWLCRVGDQIVMAVRSIWYEDGVMTVKLEVQDDG